MRIVPITQPVEAFVVRPITAATGFTPPPSSQGKTTTTPGSSNDTPNAAQVTAGRLLAGTASIPALPASQTKASQSAPTTVSRGAPTTAPRITRETIPRSVSGTVPRSTQTTATSSTYIGALQILAAAGHATEPPKRRTPLVLPLSPAALARFAAYCPVTMPQRREGTGSASVTQRASPVSSASRHSSIRQFMHSQPVTQPPQSTAPIAYAFDLVLADLSSKTSQHVTRSSQARPTASEVRTRNAAGSPTGDTQPTLRRSSRVRPTVDYNSDDGLDGLLGKDNHKPTRRLKRKRVGAAEPESITVSTLR